MYRESDMFQLKCIISDVDGKQYCVRERAKLELAADLLATTTKNMQLLVDGVNEKYPDRDNVKRLVKSFLSQEREYAKLKPGHCTNYDSHTETTQ